MTYGRRDRLSCIVPRSSCPRSRNNGVERVSTEHKAYAFAYKPFSTELKPVLEAALASGNCRELIDFIERERSNLTDPYEGEPLGDDWEQLMEFKDAHQYGDFAPGRRCRNSRECFPLRCLPDAGCTLHSKMSHAP
jgi:hypothetical protein